MAHQLNKRRENSSTGVRFSYEGIGIIIPMHCTLKKTHIIHIFLNLVYLYHTDMWVYHLRHIEHIHYHVYVMGISA